MKNEYKHNSDNTTTIYYESKVSGVRLETVIDTSDFPKANEISGSWYISKHGKNAKYRVKGKLNDGKRVYLYRHIIGANDESLVVDHIDGNTLNNKRLNLRVVTQNENAQNQNHGRSELPLNVNYNPRDNKYRVTFVMDGRRKSFGQYHNLEEAEKVAIEARNKLKPTQLV